MIQPALPFRRVCFVMPFHIAEMRGGGAEVQAWLLARELARRGFEVSYVAQSVEGKAGRVERREGVDLHWLPYREHLRWLWSRDWYRALKRIDPDLLVQRMASETTGVVGLYARLHRKPFSWICCGDAIPTRWLFLRRQKRANREHAPGPLRSLVFLADAAVRDVLRHAGMRWATHAFTQNEHQRRRLESSFGMSSERMPSGHPPPAAPRPAEARRQDGIVLWAATLGAHKRPELFGTLARFCRGMPLRFVMAGGHADRARVARIRAGLPANVEALGAVPFEEAGAWFGRAAAFVNTSAPDGEGFPNTFVQAWLHGVPVLTLGADPDGLIARHRLGFVAPDVEALAAGLRDLLADAGAYAACAARVEEFARERFTVERVADAFLSALT